MAVEFHDMLLFAVCVVLGVLSMLAVFMMVSEFVVEAFRRMRGIAEARSKRRKGD